MQLLARYLQVLACSTPPNLSSCQPGSQYNQVTVLVQLKGKKELGIKAKPFCTMASS